MSTKTEMSITPGLINLNMNIMFVLDSHQIEDEIRALEIRQQMEHQCVHHVLQNMIAILKTKLPKERLFAKGHLEHILNRDRHNLNALADLEHIYRTLYRTDDAEKCKKDKEKIMNGSSEFYNQCKAICLMEQGYATLHDMAANIENIANNKLTDSYKMLQAEHHKSDVDRRDILQKCVFYNKQAIVHLDKSINCKRVDPYFIRKVDGLHKFQQGLATCENLPHRNIWDYYIAEAWNRHVDSLQKLPSGKDVADRKEEIKTHTCEALELFFRIANAKDVMEKKNIYVSRSLAQIGHILIKRSHRLVNVGSDFAFVNDEKFREFRKKPFIAIEKAYEMQKKCPDTFILNRYGRALLNLADREINRKEKQKILGFADEVLTISINNAQLNWFAYSTRMLVSEHLCDLFVSQDHQKARMHLQNACEDGHQCFISKGSSIDMECLAKICQKMAKFPCIEKFGKHNVRHVQYLHYALDYLQHGLTVSGTHDHQLSNRMASCLYDLGNFTSAAEWMKRTLALMEKPKIFNYKIACLYQLKRFWSESKEKHPLYLIKEIVYMLHECQKKFGDIAAVSEYIVRNDFSTVSGLITDTINVPNLLTQEGLEIIKAIIKFSSGLTNLQPCVVERLKSFEVQIEHIRPLSEDEVNFDETFENPIAPIPIPTDTSLVPPGFQYNFFVSHSQKDIEWVINVLLFELENKFTEEDLAFKGCIDARDFQPGKSIIQNITDAITKSYKIILVLTKHFIDSRWCKDEMEKAITRHIGEKDCVIPLLLEPLEDKEFPHCLTNITYLDLIDLTNESQRMQQFGKLKKALLTSC